MNPEQSLALFHMITNLFEQVYTGTGALNRSGQNADFINAGIVNAFNRSFFSGNNFPDQIAEHRLRRFALSMDDFVHGLQGLTGIQQFFGDKIPLSAAQLGIKL